jgi:serine/threonine protein phosphatase PrpC
MTWKTSSAQIIGTSHIKQGVVCQDFAISEYFSHGRAYCAALSDGAGSAKFSQYGAEVIVNTISKTISKNFNSWYENFYDQNFKKGIFSTVLRDVLAKKASELCCDTKDLLSTLLVVAVKGDRYLAIHIGDGVIGYEEDYCVKVLSHPENGEFSNSTVFVTSQKTKHHITLDHLRFYKGSSKNITGFILMSDGPESALYEKSSQALVPACSKLLQATRELTENEMKEQLEFTIKSSIQKKTTDDCSIAILARGA